MTVPFRRVAPFFLLALAAGALSFAGCRSCSQSPAEPGPSARVPASTASSSPLSREELRDVTTRLEPGLCELAAKKANQVYGRPETDKKGIDVLTRCLRLGNVAWYRCVVEAKAPDELKRCHSRYLLPADEIPKASP
jgi:hypothetical protein